MTDINIKLPSASKLGLAMKCRGSFILPQVRSEPGPEAEKGTEIHSRLEEFFEAGRVVPSSFSEEHTKICEAVAASICSKPDLGEFAERELLLDSDGWLPKINKFRSDLTDEQRSRVFVGHADYIGIASEKKAIVLDFKTGASYVDEPKWNWQLIFPGICLWIISGKSNDFSCELGIVHARDVESSGKCKTEIDQFDGSFFERAFTYLKEMHSASRRESASTVKLYEGKHCNYCQSRDRCPAKVGAIASAISVVSSQVATDAGIVLASMTLDDCRAQIKKSAISIVEMNGGVLDLGDGREAVLDVDRRGKKKVFARKKKDHQQ